MNDRNETIKTIKAALQRRSGKTWSVTGGRGTAWGWIKIEAPTARRTWGHRLKSPNAADIPENYEPYDSGEPDRGMSPADCAELGRLLGLDSPTSTQGVSVASSSAYYAEYVDRANGRTPAEIAQPYWD